MEIIVLHTIAIAQIGPLLVVEEELLVIEIPGFF